MHLLALVWEDLWLRMWQRKIDINLKVQKKFYNKAEDNKNVSAIATIQKSLNSYL